jgi:hypothetical protein
MRSAQSYSFEFFSYLVPFTDQGGLEPCAD